MKWHLYFRGFHGSVSKRLKHYIKFIDVKRSKFCSTVWNQVYNSSAIVYIHIIERISTSEIFLNVNVMRKKRETPVRQISLKSPLFFLWIDGIYFEHFESGTYRNILYGDESMQFLSRRKDSGDFISWYMYSYICVGVRVGVCMCVCECASVCRECFCVSTYVCACTTLLRNLHVERNANVAGILNYL